jgi:hypothetical protein
LAALGGKALSGVLPIERIAEFVDEPEYGLLEVEPL